MAELQTTTTAHSVAWRSCHGRAVVFLARHARVSRKDNAVPDGAPQFGRFGLLATMILLATGLGIVSLALPTQAATGVNLGQADRQLSLPDYGRTGDMLRSSSAVTYYAYLPMVKRPEICGPTGEHYEAISVNNWQPAEYPAESHPDLNLAIRGYILANEYLGLLDVGGSDPQGPPQLATLFAAPRLPSFTAAYRVYDWLWGCCRGDPIEEPPVTLLGLGATPGETIHVPSSGYTIGGGYQVLVLYASQDRLTIKYTREDTIVGGYGIHLENICADPDLLALYQASNAAGRYQLPALRAGQALGRARSNFIGVVMRDTGFLDPRWRYDWWQGY